MIITYLEIAVFHQATFDDLSIFPSLFMPLLAMLVQDRYYLNRSLARDTDIHEVR